MMKNPLLDIDFEHSIGPWIGKTSKIMDYYLHEAMGKHQLDLSKEQMILLKKLHIQDGLSQNELAALIYRDKSSLTRLLSKMETKGYISRKQSLTDKRSNQIFLTDTGRNIFQKTRPVIQELMHTMEQDFTIAERKLLIQLLQKVQFNFTGKKQPL